MPKQLYFNEEARRSLKRGVDTVADAVKTTLGPRGRNVSIDKKFGAPTVTHDGVTVAKAIDNELKSLAKPVRDRADIAHVAAISAADSEIGELIAEVMEKVGKDGVITVEESKGTTFEKEYTEGMQIDRGYISAYFVTNSERMEAELEEPYILITDKKISAINEILPVLEKALQVTKNLVIIAEDVDGEALPTLVLNKLRGTVNA